MPLVNGSLAKCIITGYNNYVKQLFNLSDTVNLKIKRENQIMSLAGQLGDVLSSVLSLTERMIIMVTWNDIFTFVIMLMAILTYIDQHGKHKK